MSQKSNARPVSFSIPHLFTLIAYHYVEMCVLDCQAPYHTYQHYLTLPKTTADFHLAAGRSRSACIDELQLLGKKDPHVAEGGQSAKPLLLFSQLLI
jgi:hypothetical protein